MNFDEAMTLTRTVSSHAAFEDEECKAYFDTLMSLTPGSLIVEVGLEYGRSSAIALQVANVGNLHYLGIDPFVDANSYPAWLGLANRTAAQFELQKGISDEALIYNPISAILIDGDHSYDQVLRDCEHFLPLVVNGGYAMFHDYGRDSLPEVFRAVNDYMSIHPEFTQVKHVGTLGIWRRE
jgi:cephalosporin hydroxylase